MKLERQRSRKSAKKKFLVSSLLSERTKVGGSKPRKRATRAAKAAHPKYVVGIGASAGGLEALRALIGSLKEAKQMCYVVVQHLSPQHRSRLAEIISQGTRLRVKDIEEGERPVANTVYITPPNFDVLFESGRLRLRKPSLKIGPKPSVDLFFKSLADEVGENAIGVILSGTGTDGSEGVRAIKSAGGLTITQSSPSAKYDGMPRAAMHTGSVDLDLSPEQIAKQLAHLDRHVSENGAFESASELGWSELDDPYATILYFLQSETKVNFSQYKPSTVRRRVDRRVVATHSESLPGYLQYLRAHPEESKILFQEILISVTSFFRDAESFRAVGDVLQGRIKQKAPGQPLRAWVVGCATGEEAYSIAILLCEALEKSKKSHSIQIFATDLDEEAMTVARKGSYPAGVLSEVSAELRDKYFETSDGRTYRVRDFLREMVIFARHDVGSDPPFLKLDLVTCRNVLIYFNRRLQEDVLKTFHYALDASGILFLGKSESATEPSALFEARDKSAKIYLRSAKKGDLPKTFSRHEFHRETSLMNKDRESNAGFELFNSMVASFATNSVLIDEDQRVKHIYGNANRYLNFPKGSPSGSIAKLVPTELAIEITALVHRAAKSGQLVKGQSRARIGTGKSARVIQLAAAPLSHEGRKDYLIIFQDCAPEPRPKASKNITGLSARDQAEALREQLAAAREQLKMMIDEHETANQEMQALNEELQSSNEELQSTNEEFETTNEELQSANEELTTLNQEVNVKSGELQALNQRLQAIQNAIYYPLMIVDQSCRVLDYNPAARFVFRIHDSDRGSTLKALNPPLDSGETSRLVQDCLSSGRDGKLQLQISNREYEIRVQLIRGFKDQVSGAVVSFVDNTDLVRALAESRMNQERLNSILDHTPAFVTIKDTSGAYLFANRRFCDEVGKSSSELSGKSDEDIFGAELGHEIRARDYDVLKYRKPLQFEERVVLEGRQSYWLSSKFPLLDSGKKPRSVCNISFDVTPRIQYERQLEIFRKVLSSANAGIAILESGRKGQSGDYRSTWISEEFSKHTGAAPDALSGLQLGEFLKRAFPRQAAEHVRWKSGMLRSKNFTTVFLSDEQGEPLWLELRTLMLSFPSLGSTKYLLVKLFDVTREVQAQKVIRNQQEELARFGKLASLGEISAGISHEINTPLNVIKTKADFIRRLSQHEKLDQERVLIASTEIEKMVTNISNVITGLKSISGMGAEESSMQDLNYLVQEAVKICDFRIHRFGIELRIESSKKRVNVPCFPVQIVQVLINLINNAIDAVVEVSGRWIQIQIKENPDEASILISDSGKGVPVDIAEKIMAPFFTTKKSNNGTGLGLSLSRTIARRHGGDLKLVVDAPFTTFVLELPKKPIKSESADS